MDVTQLTDLSGDVTRDYDYDPYGVQLTDATGDTNPFRYKGEYFDEETGFIYLRARYYDPAIGRFISLDPAKDGLNWYVYCGNNPINFCDPTGLDMAPANGPSEDTIKALAALGVGTVSDDDGGTTFVIPGYIQEEELKAAMELISEYIFNRPEPPKANEPLTQEEMGRLLSTRIVVEGTSASDLFSSNVEANYPLPGHDGVSSLTLENGEIVKGEPRGVSVVMISVEGGLGWYGRIGTAYIEDRDGNWANVIIRDVGGGFGVNLGISYVVFSDMDSIYEFIYAANRYSTNINTPLGSFSVQGADSHYASPSGLSKDLPISFIPQMGLTMNGTAGLPVIVTNMGNKSERPYIDPTSIYTAL